MTPRFVFLLEAQAELQEASSWYAERAPGLELEFSRAVDAAIAAIADSRNHFPSWKRICGGQYCADFPIS